MSFFTAFDPESKNSGYKDSRDQPIYDITVREQVIKHFVEDMTFFQRVSSTYDIILGKHYDINIDNKTDSEEMGRKGALDYLILPLLSRKLMHDGYKPAKGITLANVSLLAIALTIEAARVGTAFALTALLIPVIALVHALKDYLCPAPSNLDQNLMYQTNNHVHP